MKRLVSGIQPTGQLTLGNYIGAIKQFVALQDTLEDTEFFIFIADLHAITTPQDKTTLRKSIKSVAALYLACGLDPNKVNLFIQSEVPEHVQLGYIMESTAYIGEMERMTQFKDKRQKQLDGIRTSLLTYPALMAADILIYDADIVPIGDDQKQHLELARNLAERFNSIYGNTFVVPEGFYPKTGARIKSLVEPTKKMSKSDDNQKGYILLLDDLNAIKNKIKGAVTDSDRDITYDTKNKPGISNLLTIYAALTDRTINDIVKQYQQESYQTFKSDLADIVVNIIEPIQKRYHHFLGSELLDEVLDKGRDYATSIAYKKLRKIYRKIGIGR